MIQGLFQPLKKPGVSDAAVGGGVGEGGLVGDI